MAGQVAVRICSFAVVSCLLMVSTSTQAAETGSSCIVQVARMFLKSAERPCQLLGPKLCGVFLASCDALFNSRRCDSGW